MLSRLIPIILLALGILFYYLDKVNPEVTRFYLTGSKVYEAPVIVIVMAAFVAGALLVVLIALAADLRNAVVNWGRRKEEKLRERIQTLCAEGRRLLNEGRWKKARETFQDCLDKDPAHLPGLLGSAEALRLLGDKAGAQRFLDKARGLARGDVSSALAVSKGYEEAGLLREAIEVLAPLAPREEDNFPLQKRLSDLYRQAGMWKEAHQAQREVVRLSDEDGPLKEEERLLLGLKYQYASSLINLGDFEGSMRLLKEIIRQEESFLPAYVSLGDAYLRHGEIEEASRIWERGYKLFSASVFLLRLEELHLSQEEPEAAINMYRRAMEERPETNLPGLFLGRLYLRLEMVDEALEHLKELASKGEESYYLHLLTGEVYRRRSHFDKAVEEFAKALGFKRKPAIPFVCTNCEKEYPEWEGVCSSCGRFNTIFVREEIR